MMVFKERTEHSKYRIKNLLRERIGIGAASTEDVSMATGISVRMIRNHISYEGSSPNESHMLAYIQFFGPSFVNAWLEGTGVGETRVTRTQDGCLAEATAAQAKIASEFITQSTLALEDLRVDHREKPLLLRRARTLLETCSVYAASIEKGSMN